VKVVNGLCAERYAMYGMQGYRSELASLAHSLYYIINYSMFFYSTASPERVLTERDIATLMNLMHNFSDKWNKIGLGLGFVPSELRQISSSPSLLMSAPAGFLITLLSQWVQWPTKAHSTKPTLGALSETLRGSLVGLGSLAEQVERELKCSSTGKSIHV
jgi:hypothetical protein